VTKESIITASSARDMNLKPGQTATALIKATDAMIFKNMTVTDRKGLKGTAL
jgi:molybdopterin-binding protein